MGRAARAYLALAEKARDVTFDSLELARAKVDAAKDRLRLCESRALRLQRQWTRLSRADAYIWCAEAANTGRALAIHPASLGAFKRVCSALHLVYDAGPGELRLRLVSGGLTEGDDLARLTWEVDTGEDEGRQLLVAGETLQGEGEAWVASPELDSCELHAEQFTRVPDTDMTFEGNYDGAMAVITGGMAVTVVSNLRMSLFAGFVPGGAAPGQRWSVVFAAQASPRYLDVSRVANRLGFLAEEPDDCEGVLLGRRSPPRIGSAAGREPDGEFWPWDRIADEFVQRISLH